MKYTVKIDKQALKALGKLPARQKRQIARKIDSLAEDPHPSDATLIKGQEDIWMIRQGSYRIAYKVMKNVLLILVVHIGHRKDFYRYFSR